MLNEERQCYKRTKLYFIVPTFDPSTIQQVALHRIGNKATAEGYILSDKLLPLNEQLQEVLMQYFVSPFKGDEYFNLFDEVNIEMNDIYRYVTDIFNNPDTLLDTSREIAKKLYDSSTHANIKGGDLFVVYFDECSMNGEKCSAIGLFKAENQDRYLKIGYSEEQWSKLDGDESAKATFNIEIAKGINVNKLDKGAIIFNLSRDEGYIVSTVDATNRSLDAAYWRDTFLQIRQREDEYYNTHTEMTAYKKFVTDELPQKFENVSKADQADLLNRSMEYFKQNDTFDVQHFAEEVIAQPEVIESFTQYREQYQRDNAIELADQFDIDDSAVKKQSRAYKSVIKLDKNFHIYVHGNRELIEQGEDERGKFYKVYYNEEN